MFINSLKQLFRTPGKTVLFFLLTAACTLLLVFGSVMLADTSRRIDEVENSFTTIGMVEQDVKIAHVPRLIDDDCYGTAMMWGDEYDDSILIDVLNFEGAEYVQPPEDRPYYVARLPEFAPHPISEYETNNYVQFTALEDLTEKAHPIQIRVDKILCSANDSAMDYLYLVASNPKTLAEGEDFTFCECMRFADIPITPLEKGKSYVCNLFYQFCEFHGKIQEVIPVSGPSIRQYNADGTRRGDGSSKGSYRVDEVTEGYWDEGGKGQDWLNAIAFLEERPQLFYVIPTNALQLIPAFQYQQAFLSQGREITPEEFSSGAQVCMISEGLMEQNNLNIGDKLTLPLVYALYNQPEEMVREGNFVDVTNLKEGGGVYEPFWEAEYEIVGSYSQVSGSATGSGKFPAQAFIIPSKSVQASDSENIVMFEPMNPWTSTFQIKNGTIEEFDAALRENVPEMDSLTVTYNDNGYTDIMASLQSTRTTAVLLFAAGVLAALAILALLLYFFIVKQKKRTAVERGLGLTKRQCRVSLISGVLVLTLLASIAGTAGGAVLLNFQSQANAETAVTEEAEEETVSTAEQTEEPAMEPAGEAAPVSQEETGGFSTKYSLWAQAQQPGQEFTASEAQPSPLLYLLPPLALLLLVFLLSLALVNRNLKTDPMLLLGGKSEL